MKEKNVSKTPRFEKNDYISRVSLLDDFDEDSEINKSYFRGFKNMGKIIGVFLIITIPLVHIHF